MNAAQPRIVSIGDISVDVISASVTFPVVAGGHQQVASASMEPGGSSNFMIAAARLGLQVTALGVVGADPVGPMVLQLLAEAGVATAAVRVQAGGTTTVVNVFVDAGAQNVFVFAHGTGPQLALEPDWLAAIDGCAALMVWGYGLQEQRLRAPMLAALEYAHVQGVPVYFDPGPHLPDFEKLDVARILRCTHTVLLTADELPLLADGQSGTQAVATILSKGPALVCVKRGAAGSSTYTRHAQVAHSGYAVPVLDTTGCGDTFAAGFLYAAVHAWPAEQQASLANAAGAAKAAKLGTGRQVPTLAEIQQLLRANGVALPWAP
ncbi:MAG: hypothetical protein RLY92_876 [Chloroflexota bacterium]